MARKQTLDAIIQLYKKLGGNTSEVLGTKTNVNFLGKGKSPELMLDMDINADALAVLPQSKAVEELTSSVGYAVSGKLNDIQANQLLKNMQTMDSVYFPPAAPANVTDLATGTRDLDKAGLMSLRQGGDPTKYKAGDPITSENFAATGFAPSDEVLENLKKAREMDDLPPPGSRGGPDDIAAPFSGAGLEAIKNVKGSNLIVDDIVNKIYLNAGVSANAQPVARANAREFLNRIKDLEDPSFPDGPTLSSVMEADDFRFMTEGGGGGMGDPLLLVQKYFGPKVASSVAQLDSADDIQKFAERLVAVKDAKGRNITDRNFDPDMVDPEDFEFADGGRVGFNMGGGQFTSGGNISPGTDASGNVRDDNPFTGGGGGGDNQTTNTPPVTPFIEKDSVINKIPVKTGLEAILSDNAKLKAFLDLEDSLKEQELAGQVDFTGKIGELDIGASANLAGDKNLNLDYQTKGGTNIGLETDLGDNAMFKISRTFADGGLARPGFFRGKLVGKALGLYKRKQALERGAGEGFAAVEQYGITGKDITRMFKELAIDPSLQGKEKTEYFKVLNQALKNPEEFPDTIKEIQMKLGIDIGTGFRNGGLAGILEV